jgi:ABC-type lipoprotein release transport system permease subunit
MNAIGTWLRVDLRNRWRSLVILALLVAFAGGTIIAAVAGARRGDTALRRLDAVTLPATAVVLPNQPGFNWRRVERLPEVASVSTFAVDYTLSYLGLPADVDGFPPANSTILRSIEKPVVFQGRVFNPRRLDEAVVTPMFVANHHLGVGKSVVLQLPTAKEMAAGKGSGPGGALTGPRLRLRIVGVVRSPWISDAPGSDGAILMSPAVAARYPLSVVGAPGNQLSFVNALVRLHGGEVAIPRLRRDIARLTGREDIDIWDLPQQYADAQRQIAFEARCLVALAVAAFLASLFLVGQTLARFASASGAELQIMRALGMTSGEVTGAVMAAPALAGLAGAGLAAGFAVAVSAWFPIGTAALLEPSPGVSADWVVIGPAVALVALLVAGGAALAGRATLAAGRRHVQVRGSATVAAAARAGFPVPIVVGARFALEPGRGPSAVPVRPAQIGAVAGVLGIVAAFTFSYGVSDTVADPGRFGQTFQLISEIGLNGKDFGPAPQLVRALDRLPAVSGVDDSRIAVATGGGGAGSISLYEYHAGGPKAIPVVVFRGRMPRSAHEVLLAPRTLAALHARVGSRVRLAGNRATEVLTVTGSGLVPEGSHNSYADGGWLTPAGFSGLFSGFKFHIVLVRTGPGVPVARAGQIVRAQLTRAAPRLASAHLEPAQSPTEMAELGQVKVLPVVLGVFLALLAIGAVGHALVTVVQRRIQDVAVLRVMGMTPRQCRLIVFTQGLVLALAGLLIGLPVGLVVGRLLWRTVASYTPVQYVPPIATAVMVVIVPAALVLTSVLGAWPGHRAAGLRVANALRAE